MLLRARTDFHKLDFQVPKRSAHGFKPKDESRARTEIVHIWISGFCIITQLKTALVLEFYAEILLGNLFFSKFLRSPLKGSCLNRKK